MRKFTSSKSSVFLEHQFFYSDFWEQVFFILISRNRSYILLYYLLYSFFPELSSVFEVYYSVIVEISTATKCSTFPYYYYGFSEWYFVFSEQCSGLLELIIPTHLTQPYIRLCISWVKWVEKIYYAFPEQCSGLLELIIPTRLTQQYIRLCTSWVKWVGIINFNKPEHSSGKA